MKQSIYPQRSMGQYRLVEHFANGAVVSEDFPAPSDDEAIRRALEVCSASRVELWRGDTLIDRLPRTSREPRAFALSAVAPAITASPRRYLC